MALGERRSADLGPAGRRPLAAPGAGGRRSDRVRRLTTMGVAAALAMASRHTARPPPASGPPQVEARSGPPSPPEIGRAELDALIEEAAAAYGVSAHLVRAVVQAESAFDPSAVSPAGAQGLMQLMPATATLLGVSDPLDPRQNVFGGTRYLGQLLDRFDGNVALALAGYNAGPTRVARLRDIPPYGETRGYVRKIRGILAASTGHLFPLPRVAAIRRVRLAARPAVPRAVASRLVSSHPRPRRAGQGRRG